MRVSCTPSSTGSTYRVYRAGDDFIAHVKRLVPLLQADRCDVLIGPTDSEPDVVLTVMPLDAETDAEFRQRVVQYLDT